jgi:hypothetical protein
MAMNDLVDMQGNITQDGSEVNILVPSAEDEYQHAKLMRHLGWSSDYPDRELERIRQEFHRK